MNPVRGQGVTKLLKTKKNMSVGFNFDSEIKTGSVLFTRTVLLPSIAIALPQACNLSLLCLQHNTLQTPTNICIHFTLVVLSSNCHIPDLDRYSRLPPLDRMIACAADSHSFIQATPRPCTVPTALAPLYTMSNPMPVRRSKHVHEWMSK